MFIIVNGENRIIAASSRLLDRVGVKSIYELPLFQERDIINLDTQTWQITFKNSPIVINGEASSIVSVFGGMTFINIKEIKDDISLSSLDSGISHSVPIPKKSKAPLTEDSRLVDLLLSGKRAKEEAKAEQTTQKPEAKSVVPPKVTVTINQPKVKKPKKIVVETEQENNTESDSTIKKATLVLKKGSKEGIVLPKIEEPKVENTAPTTPETKEKLETLQEEPKNKLEDIGSNELEEKAKEPKEEPKEELELNLEEPKDEGILSLDEILESATKSEEEVKSEPKKEEEELILPDTKESKEDELDLSLDDLLLEEPNESKEKAKEPKEEELDLTIEEPKEEESKKEEPKEEAKDEIEEFSIDDLLLEEPNESEEKPQEEPKEAKEEESKPQEPKEEELDLSLDDLLLEEPNESEAPKAEEEPKDKDLPLEDDELFSLLDEDEQEETPVNEAPKATETKEGDELLNDDIFDLLSDDDLDSSSETAKSEPKESIASDITPEDDEIFDIVDNETQSSTPEVEAPKVTATPQEESNASDEEMLSMLSDMEDTTPSNQEGEPKWKKLLDEFHFDLNANASNAGMDIEEYQELIDFFLQENQRVEADLKSDDNSKVDEASRTLEDAAILLQLEPLPEFFRLLREDSSSSDRKAMVDAYYEKIVDELMSNSKEEHTSAESAEEVELEPELEIEEIEPEEATSAPEATVKNSNCNIGSLDELLSDKNAIPINFSLKMAAEELNLPEELVLEFINDFSSQGHEYLPVLIESCQDGDLDKLQKTAHMLKGAASNLRIEPMVDNLYQLQYDEDINNAPERIKKFAGQLVGLDHYLEQFKN